MESKHLLRSEQTVLPNISSRTLLHPSFMSLFMHTSFTDRFPHEEDSSQTVHPLIPMEVFYSDPIVGCRRRIPNKLTGMRVSNWSQLNTPRPIMSTCLVPPNSPDPFRFGPHPTRDLGSSTWRTQTKCPPAHPTRVILQLTEEEDQAVTNLLKLHHQEVPQTHNISAAHIYQDDNLKDSYSAKEANKHVCTGQNLKELHQGKSWSGIELEVANTLLSGFNQKDEDLPRTPKQCQSPISPLMYQSSGTPEECETLSALMTCGSDQNDSLSTCFSCVRGKAEIWSEENRIGCLENKLASPPSASLNLKTRSRSTESMRTDLEGDAVRVLLSLKDVVTFDIVQ